MDQPKSNMLNTVANANTSSDPFIEVFAPRPPNANDINYPVQKRWFDTVSNEEWILIGFTSFNATLQAVWSLITGSQSLLEFDGGTGTAGTFPVVPSAGGAVTLSSNAGTIVITGSNNALNFDLAGGTTAIDSINVDNHTAPGTDPVLPDATGLMTVTGAQITNAGLANVIRTNSLAANTYTIEIQQAGEDAVANANKNGVSHYNSAHFTVDPLNGFVSLDGTGAIQTLTADSGGALSPTAGNFNLLGSGSFTTVGAGSTITGTLTGLTNHSVLVGAGTTTITKLAVGTNGQVLIGSTAADPVFGTLTSSDSSITFTPGPGTLSLQVTGGTTVGKTITGNSGGALSPTGGNWNIVGTGDITTTGAGSTLTISSPLEVTSTAVIGDNTLVRGDGGARGVQTSVAVLGDEGNLDIAGTQNGAGNYIILRNTNNTALSDARIESQVEGSSGGDAFFSAGIASGGQVWSWGLKNTDSDAWVLNSTTGVTLTGTTMMRVSTSGTTSLVFQTAGGSGTPSSNSMAYYEEGSFTPTLTGASTAGTTTYSTQQGYYTKIGNLVFVTATIVISAATGTGNAVIGGLPFTVKNQTNGAVRGTVAISSTAWAWPASTTTATVTFTVNATNATINCFGNAVASSSLQMTNGAATFVISGCYQV